MQLAEETDASPAGTVDREHRLRPDLKVSADPDYAGVDRAGRNRTIAEIVGDGRLELRLNDWDQMIDKVRQLVIVNFRF